MTETIMRAVNYGFMGGTVFEEKGPNTPAIYTLRGCVAGNSVLNCNLNRLGVCKAHLEGVQTNGKILYCGRSKNTITLPQVLENNS